jgi:hypothetical protein
MTEDEEDLYGEAASKRPIYTFHDEYVKQFAPTHDYQIHAGLLCRQRDTASGVKEVALVLGTNERHQSLLLKKEMPLIDNFPADSRKNAREGADFRYQKLLDEDGNEEEGTVVDRKTYDHLANYHLSQWQDVKRGDDDSKLDRVKKGKELLPDVRKAVYDAYKAEPDPLAGENYHFGLSESSVWNIVLAPKGEETAVARTEVDVSDSASMNYAGASLQLEAQTSGMIYFPGAAAGAKLRLKIKLTGQAGRFEYGPDPDIVTNRPRQAVTLNPVLRVFTLPVRWANRYAAHKTKHLTYADLPLPTIEVPGKTAEETGRDGYSSKAFEQDDIEVDLTIPESRCVRFAILPSPEDPITWARDQLEDTALPDEYYENSTSTTSVTSSDISVSIRAEITLDECQFIE